ncbi:MAG TPA: TonB-dependent receptor [Flavobacterium sp.]|nr:TonB-dependent receptor [Flavobacterium sp.]
MKIFFLLCITPFFLNAQTTIKGTVFSENNAVLPFASIQILELKKGTSANENGFYSFDNISNGSYTILFYYAGYQSKTTKIIIENQKELNVNGTLFETIILNEVVLSGTLKPVSRLETPVPVEVYLTSFFKKNPTSNVFEALQNINGVRPQLNCAVCNTGDIRINGLEGPYTMVTIDGMPIVSALATVYGLSGIPNALIEKIEVVKGPASSLYGSEAVGGLINIITKKPELAPILFADIFTTSWLETNLDLGTKFSMGKKTNALLGVNYFNYNNPIDHNKDNFTDIALQHRISIFNSYNINRKSGKKLRVASRYFYEDRWGGEMQWNKSFRGGTAVYGESIYTNRFELLGTYQLPITENINTSFSYTNHNQNSVYGNVFYLGQQNIAFVQTTWDKKINNHDMLFGVAYRNQFYNDNTSATLKPSKSSIYSLFAQDEIMFSKNQSVLLGSRFDYNSIHGTIFTPRFAYKYKFSKDDIFRINAGTGFRVVSLFTEEHAALTGARAVVIKENLNPEQSYNININYLKKIEFSNSINAIIEFSGWFTHFENQIIPDYDTNPNEIIYANLNGFSRTYGGAINTDFVFPFGLKTSMGITMLQSINNRNGVISTPILTEKFSATWSASYDTPNGYFTIDYTGNLYGPMRLPLLGTLDPRNPYAPFWSIQNIQITYKKIKHIQIYGGIKNLLNWTPNKNNPFLIARANDPFDKDVRFDANGNVQPSPNNPFALTFDPTYIYAPNQGIRAFVGLRFNLD